MHSVAITGIGMVTPMGATAAETIRAWTEGESALPTPLDSLEHTPLSGTRIALPPSFDAAARLGGRKMLKYMSGSAVLSCIAAHDAMAQARVSERFSPERVGLYAATGLAAADVQEVETLLDESIDAEGAFSCRLLGEKGLAAANPLLSFRILANMPACLVSIIEDIKGPNLIFTPTESQAGLALQEAWLAVGKEEVDCAVTGGADTPANPSTLVYLRQAGWLQEGEVPANAGAYLVLERLDSALAQGQRVYGIIQEVNVLAPTEQAATCHMDGSGSADPLASRIGRTFVAAPAILAGLKCHDPLLSSTLTGADGWTVALRIKGQA